MTFFSFLRKKELYILFVSSLYKTVCMEPCFVVVDVVFLGAHEKYLTFKVLITTAVEDNSIFTIF